MGDAVYLLVSVVESKKPTDWHHAREEEQPTVVRLDDLHLKDV
jgi:hypothetical protein